MGNLFSTETIWFYLVSEGKKKPYKRVGPFRLEAIAQVYKEEQINDDTFIWTNEKMRMEPNKKKKSYMEGWKKIRDMPEPFQAEFHSLVARVPDRRQQSGGQLAPLPTMTGYGHVAGPSIPMDQ
mmetsp:Transcript_19968/g.34331  ORF Transcript_19968/g.34331 Transcript_19968/m.34331 type:complete len:124 (+) Transcript_19968:328-699(+)